MQLMHVAYFLWLFFYLPLPYVATMDLGQKSDASYHQELDGIESVDHLNVQGILEFQESNGEDCPTLQLDSSVRMLTSLTDSLSKYHPFMYLDACGPINNNMAVPVAAKEEELERYYDNLRLKYQTLNLNIIPDVADFYPYRQWRQKAMKKQVQDNSLFSIIINGFVSIFNMSSDVVDKVDTLLLRWDCFFLSAFVAIDFLS